MMYYVTLKVEGRFVAEVEASSIEEAKQKAVDEFCNADFGSLEDIEGESVIVEDENGNFVWER